MRKFLIVLFAFMCGAAVIGVILVIVGKVLTKSFDGVGFKSYETKLTSSFIADSGDKGWNRFKPSGGIFFIEDVGKQYEVKVELSVMDGFEYNLIPVEIVITSPSGQTNVLNKNLIVKDKEGNHIGKAVGDVWTVEQIIYPNKEFTEKGEYSVSIQHRTQYYDLLKVKSISFSVASLKKKTKSE